jgi:hypothetical protein
VRERLTIGKLRSTACGPGLVAATRPPGRGSAMRGWIDSGAGDAWDCTFAIRLPLSLFSAQPTLRPPLVSVPLSWPKRSSSSASGLSSKRPDRPVDPTRRFHAPSSADCNRAHRSVAPSRAAANEAVIPMHAPAGSRVRTLPVRSLRVPSPSSRCRCQPHPSRRLGIGRCSM